MNKYVALVILIPSVVIGSQVQAQTYQNPPVFPKFFNTAYEAAVAADVMDRYRASLKQETNPPIAIMPRDEIPAEPAPKVIPPVAPLPSIKSENSDVLPVAPTDRLELIEPKTKPETEDTPVPKGEQICPPMTLCPKDHSQKEVLEDEPRPKSAPRDAVAVRRLAFRI